MLIIFLPVLAFPTLCYVVGHSLWMLFPCSVDTYGPQKTGCRERGGPVSTPTPWGSRRHPWQWLHLLHIPSRFL